MKNLIIFIISLSSFSLVAQENFILSGRVIDANSQEALEYATATLLNKTDSSLATGAITKSDGSFHLAASTGVYILKLEFIGFFPVVMDNLEIDEDMELPVIKMQANAELLNAVEIKGERSSIEYNLDKKVFNVGKDLVSKGGAATDVLGNVPSVNVDASGQVSLRGNSGVRILINGKPSVLTSNGGLETIPADNIESVEVITNPSSKYDAEGTAGIINIILKKNKKGGFSSSLQVSTGLPDDHSINYNANFKREKINFFSNFRLGKSEYLGSSISTRNDFEGDELVSILDQEMNMTRQRKVLTLYGGGDYYLDSLNTLTMSYYHRNNLSENSTNYSFQEMGANNETSVISQTSETYREPQIASQIELNYVKEFEQQGKRFSMNLQYNFWNDDENESIERRNSFPLNSVSNFKSRDIESSDDFVFQTDLTLPISEKQNLEIGGKGEVRRIDSDYKVWAEDDVIDSLDNVLEYHERIYGVYIQYGNREKRVNYQLGIRSEYAHTNSNDEKDEFKTNKKYIQLFPSANLSYSLTENTQFQLSYSRRIRRPQFWQLNPFGGIGDPRNVRIGNPDLNPMYTHSFEIGSILRSNGITFSPSIYAMYTKNLFQTSVDRVDDILLSKSINAGTEDAYGIELNTSYSPKNWWRLSHELNVYQYKHQGIFNISDRSLFSRLNSTMRFENSSIQMNINFQQGGMNGQFESRDQYWMNLAINQDLWGEKASVSFNANNVLNSRNNPEKVIGEGYTIDREYIWSGRRFRVNFTYRFNRTKKDRDRLPG